MSNKLALYELPRETVDFLQYDLPGNDMLSILGYVQLEETLSKIGTQNFDETIVKNIDIEQLQELVYENM
ncbi:hypothetical protein GQ472_07115, partial [archaeon]|nr:hypothetical protein [archaeon]